MRRSRMSIDDLWDSYNSGDQSYTDDLVRYYEPLVEKTVNRITAKLPSHVDRDDLYSTGLMGLYDAICKYSDIGYKFETYATFRIRGSVLDHLRTNDWASRALRRGNREIEEAVAELSVQYGRTPAAEEVADHLGLDMEEFHRLQSETTWSVLVHLDEVIPNNGELFSAWELVEDVSDERNMVEFDSLANRLSEVVEDLTLQEKVVMALYYREGIPLKDVGELLKVTESRACQIHTRALDKIKDHWGAV